MIISQYTYILTSIPAVLEELELLFKYILYWHFEFIPEGNMWGDLLTVSGAEKAASLDSVLLPTVGVKLLDDDGGGLPSSSSLVLSLLKPFSALEVLLDTFLGGDSLFLFLDCKDTGKQPKHT